VLKKKRLNVGEKRMVQMRNKMKKGGHRREKRRRKGGTDENTKKKGWHKREIIRKSMALTRKRRIENDTDEK
jgi:hypothetical protein